MEPLQKLNVTAEIQTNIHQITTLLPSLYITLLLNALISEDTECNHLHLKNLNEKIHRSPPLTLNILITLDRGR